jgi:predicted amidohydrolase YtcJ
MPPSLLFTHARVLTSDPLHPRAEAVAVTGDKITFVGRDRDAKALRGPNTQTIDAHGCTLLPGFIDSHYHLLLGSAEMEIADLDGIASLEALTHALRQYAADHPDAAWINGAHLVYTLLPAGQRLTRHHLDAILPDRPIALMAVDYHTLWANTRALEIAGLLHGAQTTPGSAVILDPDGLATGELREPAAYKLVLQHTGAWGRLASNLAGFPIQPTNPVDMAEDRRLLKQGLALAARHGVTSIHNMDGSYQRLALYASLEDLGELTARLYVSLSVTPETSPQALQEAVAMQQDFRGRMARGGFIKLFIDGVMESWTAFLLDDYADRPGEKGAPLYTPEHFNLMAIEADRLGLQIAVHAIGDAAVHRALDGFEAARQHNGPRDSRHRIEHIELLHPADLPRFAALGVIASMQPCHVPDLSLGPHLWASRVGESRWHRSFAWSSLRQAGATLVFGSDWPVVPPDPLQALQRLLTRQPWAPGLPHHRQTLDDALASYTRHAAFAGFQEASTGQLRPGFSADLVLLSGDLEHTPPSKIASIHPLLTICNGKIVYQAE